MLTRRRIRVRASRRSSAPVQRVFRLLANSRSYPEWSRISACEIERPGSVGLHNVGEVRRFRTGRLTVREQIEDVVQDRIVKYRLLDGLPLVDYHAVTMLEPLPPGGCWIVWSCTFVPKYPGTGWFWRLFMSAVLHGFVRDLAAAAEHGQRSG